MRDEGEGVGTSGDVGRFFQDEFSDNRDKVKCMYVSL
jgi:hypothetical protein